MADGARAEVAAGARGARDDAGGSKSLKPGKNQLAEHQNAKGPARCNRTRDVFMNNKLAFSIQPTEVTQQNVSIQEILDNSKGRFGCMAPAVFFTYWLLVLFDFIDGQSFDFSVILALLLGFGISYLLSRFDLRSKSSEKYREAKQYSLSEARRVTEQARSILHSANQKPSELRELLQRASSQLKKAETDFSERAFSPFWSRVEEAVSQLGRFEQTLKRIQEQQKSYYATLAGRQHNFPIFPVTSQQVPDPSQALQDLTKLTRKGQKDFEFANIFEHRRTRAVLIAGFRTLEQALDNIDITIYHSIDSLAGSTEKLAHEQLRTRRAIESQNEHLRHKKR